jgi:hypothetical protein
VIVLRALGELLHIDVCGATGFTSPSKLYATGGDGSGSSGSGRLRTKPWVGTMPPSGLTAVSILGLMVYKIIDLA